MKSIVAGETNFILITQYLKVNKLICNNINSIMSDIGNYYKVSQISKYTYVLSYS